MSVFISAEGGSSKRGENDPPPTRSSQHHSHHGPHYHHTHRHSSRVPTATVLEPPAQFATIEPQVYRFCSIEWSPASVPFLRSLELKTILLLSAERPSKALTTFAADHGIRLHHYGLTLEHEGSGEAVDHADPMSMFGSAAAISKSIISNHTIKHALEQMLDVRNQPVAICDPSGVHEVGVLTGCLRRLQGWNFASILYEYRALAQSKSRGANERFIEMFDPALLHLPPRQFLVPWLPHYHTH